MKVAALNSGGIDSPVAMHVFLEQGVDVISIVFDNQPFSAPEDVETAKQTVEQLEELHNVSIPCFVVPHGFIHEQFLNTVDEQDVSYNCLFSRRVMLKTAEKIAAQEGCDFLVTGESLGQVASQTLENVIVTDAATDMKILRPLIGLDKEEIVNIAKEAGTFETSSQGGIACAAHVDYPETRGVLEKMRNIEEQFNVDALIKESMDRMEAV